MCCGSRRLARCLELEQGLETRRTRWPRANQGYTAQSGVTPSMEPLPQEIPDSLCALRRKATVKHAGRKGWLILDSDYPPVCDWHLGEIGVGWTSGQLADGVSWLDLHLPSKGATNWNPGRNVPPPAT